MQPSLAGLIVCIVVLAIGWQKGSPLVVGLFVSLTFGATGFATLTFLGGSTPLIYTLFAALLILAVALRRSILSDLGRVLGSIRPLWVLFCLMAYALVSSWMLPRLFAGQTTVFVISAARGGVVETTLAPVSGNISQTAYFLLGGLTAVALCIALLKSDNLDQVRRGFMLWCGLHAGLGVLDLLGKLAGAGDLLAPIRTASYVMLTNASQGGFPRITGAFAEASSFGTASLACLAFTFTYWRRTGSSRARTLSLVLLGLILLSTSSTAYVGLTLISIPVAISLAVAMAGGRIGPDEKLILGVLVAMSFTALAVSVVSPGFFDPFVRLLESMVINKGSSSSGLERAYWNTKSLQAFTDTAGLGVGFGSSRASSWAIAVLSQLGVVGAGMMAVLLVVVARGAGEFRQWIDPETEAVVASVKACALTGIIAASLVSGSADPGMVFFIALAVVCVARVEGRRNRGHALHPLDRRLYVQSM